MLLKAQCCSLGVIWSVILHHATLGTFTSFEIEYLYYNPRCGCCILKCHLALLFLTLAFFPSSSFFPLLFFFFPPSSISSVRARREARPWCELGTGSLCWSLCWQAGGVPASCPNGTRLATTCSANTATPPWPGTAASRCGTISRRPTRPEKYWGGEQFLYWHYHVCFYVTDTGFLKVKMQCLYVMFWRIHKLLIDVHHASAFFPV